MAAYNKNLITSKVERSVLIENARYFFALHGRVIASLAEIGKAIPRLTINLIGGGIASYPVMTNIAPRNDEHRSSQ